MLHLVEKQAYNIALSKEEFSLKFSILLSFNILAVQPNFLSQGITSKLSEPIVVSLMYILSILKVFSADRDQFSELFC